MGKVRRDWFEIFAASECQASAKAAALGEITASDIVRQAMAKLSTLNIDGPEAVAAATQALNDMHKAGALRVRPPVSHTVTARTPIKGWNFKPIEGAAIEGTGHLVRASDGASFLASAMSVLWPVQIRDFEFSEGIEWTPQQIAAITDPGHTHDIAAPVGLAGPKGLSGPVGPKASVEYGALAPREPFFVSAVAGGRIAAMTAGEPVPGIPVIRVNGPTSGMPTYYDVNFDERRPITQEILDNMERDIQRLFAERDEERSDKDAKFALLVADRNARVRERDDARKEVAHWKNECTRAVGLHVERGDALLRILGDMPSPDEDPYERCRKIASNALGYQDPEPMKLDGRKNQSAIGSNGDVDSLIVLITALGRSGAAQMDEIAAMGRERDAERLHHKQTCDECMVAEAQIDTLRTELMAARDTIARFTAANVPDSPKADPIANAIREFPRDMRRMGPL